jgi:CelD/BcsL family acetyltransferase involved in cellulose biosynthesis
MLARECTAEAEWDEFVREVPWATVHHAFRYGRLLTSCFGYLRPVYRMVEAEGRILAAVPLMEFSVAGFRSLQSLPFDIYGGPLLRSERQDDAALHHAIARDLETEACRLGAFELRLSIPVSAPPAVWRAVEAIGRFESTETDCPVLELARPLDQVRQSYRPEARRALKTSVRNRVTVEPYAAPEAVRSLYPLYRARMKEIGATVKPWRFVDGILAERLGVPFVARQGERAIGFLILLVTPAIAIYWISAMEPGAARARPMNALLDSAIAWSHAAGIPRFSFGESHGRPGLRRFKQGFGPERGRHMVAVRTYHPGVQRVWRMLEPVARQTYSTWERARASLRDAGGCDA